MVQPVQTPSQDEAERELAERLFGRVVGKNPDDKKETSDPDDDLTRENHGSKDA